MSFYFLTEFFKYFFRVLHGASSSWLKFLHAFQKHPVYGVLILTSGRTRQFMKLSLITFCKIRKSFPTFFSILFLIFFL
jgi:hypothetical protein